MPDDKPAAKDDAAKDAAKDLPANKPSDKAKAKDAAKPAAKHAASGTEAKPALDGTYRSSSVKRVPPPESLEAAVALIPGVELEPGADALSVLASSGSAKVHPIPPHRRARFGRADVEEWRIVLKTGRKWSVPIVHDSVAADITGG